MKQTIFPIKIIESKNVENINAIKKKRPLQVDLYETDVAKIGKNGGYIILDFGKEMCGGIRILTTNVSDKKNGVNVRIRFGESLTECSAELGEKNATNDHNPRDVYRLIVFASDISVGETGFRFVRIDFPEGYEVGIKTIVCENRILRLKKVNGYKGTDKTVNKIFDVAKRTLDLCASGEFIWDGIKRDRLVWSGDLYVEILSLTYLYGRVKQIETTLDFERTHAKFQGKWISMLTTYDLWWAACVAENYEQTGSVKFTEKQLDYVTTVVSQINELVDDDGTMHYVDYFFEWNTRDTNEEQIGARFISIFAINKIITLLKAFKREVKTAEKLREKLIKFEMPSLKRKQVIALKYFAFGTLTDEEYGKLIDGGAKGFSTFMSYFVLKAIASRDKSVAITLMKEYFSAMIEKGATTFWEDFDMDWVDGSSRIDCYPKKGEKDIHGDYGKYCYAGFRHSLCHAWSSGVIKFIAEYCD